MKTKQGIQNMTNTMIAAVAALTVSASAAAADGLAYLGNVEYAVEAETFEATAGIEYGISGFTFTPLVVLNDENGDFEFSSAELTVAYDINTNVNAYLTVESDEDWNHTETTVGVALRF